MIEAVELLAPAKVNLGLEILGLRTDGYHEIRTLLVPVTLFDRVRVARSTHLELWASDPGLAGLDNLAARAGLALKTNVQIHLSKRIPSAAGLGGASSDAAAVLRAIGLLNPNLSGERLREAACDLGSDVPFFLGSAPASASGRGERLKPIGPLPAFWLVIVVPRLVIHDKTRTLYRSLEPGDFTDGSRIDRLSTVFSTAGVKTDFGNAFERPLYTNWPEAASVRQAMIAAGGRNVALSGAGPAHYAICDDFRSATRLAASIRRLVSESTRIAVCRPLSGPMPYRLASTGAHCLTPGNGAS